MKGTHARSVQKGLQLRGRIHIDKVHGELYLITVSSGIDPVQEHRMSVGGFLPLRRKK